MSTLRRWLEGVTTEWQEHALCRTNRIDPQTWQYFDPVADDEPEEAALRRAGVAIDSWCLDCPVMAQCGAEADAHLYEGVYGGELRLRRGVVDVQTGIVIRRPHEQQQPPEPAVALAAPKPRCRAKPAPKPWPPEFQAIRTRKGEYQYVLVVV